MKMVITNIRQKCCWKKKRAFCVYIGMTYEWHTVQYCNKMSFNLQSKNNGILQAVHLLKKLKKCCFKFKRI